MPFLFSDGSRLEMCHERVSFLSEALGYDFRPDDFVVVVVTS